MASSSGNGGWGVELWDKFEAVVQHVNAGQDELDRLLNFLKERAQADGDYAAKLRKIARIKKSDTDGSTTGAAFLGIFKETVDLAGQHELLAEAIGLENPTSLAKELTGRVKELKDARKKIVAESGRLQNELNRQSAELERARKIYIGKFKEVDKARELWERTDSHADSPLEEVHRVRLLYYSADQQYEESKQEYGTELEKINVMRRHLHRKWVPDLLDRLQGLDAQRVGYVREFITRATAFEQSVQSIIGKCLAGMLEAANAIDERQESKRVVDKLKTGFAPPPDIPFEEPSGGAGCSSARNPTPEPKKKSTGLFSKARIFGKAGPSSSPAPLGPYQQRRKLEADCMALAAQMTQEQAAKDGLVKLQNVYRENPRLGDPSTIDEQILASTQKLAEYVEEGKKLEAQLEELGGGPVGRPEYGAGLPKPEEAPEPLPPAPQPSPEPPEPAPEVLAPDEDEPMDLDDGSSAAHEDDWKWPAPPPPELAPVLGTCVALYDFKPSGEEGEEIRVLPAMVAGQQLLVLGVDYETGWTRVRTQSAQVGLEDVGAGEEGCVPTSFVEISFYDHM